ncbi:hypothetical protein G9A89_014534 [Geosiphon pyriformis]|nr:hypothetical protein G9A89_014534 [Geosiphon pyriformis]
MLKSYIMLKKPMINEANRIKRFKWANLQALDQRHVLWTDKSSIRTDSYGKFVIKMSFTTLIIHEQPLKVVVNLSRYGDLPTR